MQENINVRRIDDRARQIVDKASVNIGVGTKIHVGCGPCASRRKAARAPTALCLRSQTYRLIY
ncbi:hypothetical protein RR48_07287 [Papilio machaon]|uniref:Uncharacterized protein n=1 Tax=Papilio machaon TaxID=76193 RepID=A0A194RL56_PAPMA|nr:hypothetical protein RR48_07287 [Papilio machaon]